MQHIAYLVNKRTDLSISFLQRDIRDKYQLMINYWTLLFSYTIFYLILIPYCLMEYVMYHIKSRPKRKLTLNYQGTLTFSISIIEMFSDCFLQPHNPSTTSVALLLLIPPRDHQKNLLIKKANLIRFTSVKVGTTLPES